MTKALRIALIASSRFPIRQPFAGGLEAHISALARGLAARGSHVSLFAADGSDPSLDAATLSVRPLRLSETAQHDVSMPSASFMAEHHAYLSLLLWLSGPGRHAFDVIHNHSLHYLPLAMEPLLSTPMLTTVHTPPTPWLESAIDASAGRRPRLVAVSRHTAAAWRDVAEVVGVVPNGIDTQHWRLGPGGPSLVWFGRITAEKAPHLAISAARRAGMPLILAGPISDPDYFGDRVAPQLSGDVRYAGHLDHAALARLVGSAAAVLVTPDWDEPYGLVVAEAMSCGTPVVAFARGGIPELVDSCAGVLVPAGDVGPMADAIPAATRLPRKAVREHAIRRCSATAMLDAYFDMYRHMIHPDKTDARDDRLLYSPSRFRTSGPRHQYLRQNAATGDSVDIP